MLKPSPQCDKCQFFNPSQLSTVSYINVYNGKRHSALKSSRRRTASQNRVEMLSRLETQGSHGAPSVRVLNLWLWGMRIVLFDFPLATPVPLLPSPTSSLLLSIGKSQWWLSSRLIFVVQASKGFETGGMSWGSHICYSAKKISGLT